VVLSGGRFATEVTGVERGGASFVDLVHDFGRPMTLRLKVANFTLLESLTSDDIRLTLLSFDDYPHLCRQPLDLTLANGVALPPPIQLDASCRFSTLVVTNSDAIAGQTILQLVAAKVDGAPAPGDVFVSVKNGFVLIYRPDGTLISMWDTGRSGEIAGSAFDAAGNFYASAFDARSIRKFAPDGTLLGDWGSGYASYPESILFDASGNAYVGNVGSQYPYNSGSIQKRAPDGTLIKTFGVELQRRGADWIALRPDGCTMLYTSEGTRILQYDVCADQQLGDFNTDTLNIKYAIHVLPNGGAIAAANYGINRYDAEGNLVQTYDHVAPLNEWFALALDPDGTSFWAGDATTGEVARFDLSTGIKLTSFLTGFTSPPTSGEAAVGGMSIMPNIGGAMSQQAMRTTQWGFDAPSPGQPHRTDPIEEVEAE
jgi:sugar lactone lactonase YvrE